MKTLILITTILLAVNSIPFVRIWLGHRPWQSHLLLFGFSFYLAWLALSPVARGVDPPPDGGYANQNTAEGEDALFSLTAGFVNTAVGFESFYSDTTGGDNY